MANSHEWLTGGASSQWVGFNPLVEPEPTRLTRTRLSLSLPSLPSLSRSRDRIGDRGRLHRRRSIQAGSGRFCRRADARELRHALIYLSTEAI